MSDAERLRLVEDWEPALKAAWDWAYSRGDREARSFFWLWVLDLKDWQE